jgi:hypothetical protein
LSGCSRLSARTGEGDAEPFGEAVAALAARLVEEPLTAAAFIEDVETVDAAWQGRDHRPLTTSAGGALPTGGVAVRAGTTCWSSCVLDSRRPRDGRGSASVSPWSTLSPSSAGGRVVTTATVVSARTCRTCAEQRPSTTFTSSLARLKSRPSDYLTDVLAAEQSLRSMVVHGRPAARRPAAGLRLGRLPPPVEAERDAATVEVDAR